MKKVNDGINKQQRPLKVVQYGEGNFLRAFVEQMIDVANEKGCFNGSVALVKPIQFGNLDRFKAQDNTYTVVLRGKANGETVNEKRIITCVSDAVAAHEDYAAYAELAKSETLEFVVSNTTEAGIVYDESDKFELIPPNTYPGKLTKFLYDRYKFFNGDASKGLIILPVELIEANGKKLKECILKLIDLWNLEEGFKTWIEEANTFCSTLVDRIVTGYPGAEAATLCKEWGYQDELIDVAEPFGLWVIESDKDIASKFPLDKAGCNVVFTDNLKPYRDRKVRILNGAHTGSVLAGYLAGQDIVRDCMHDKTIRGFMEHLLMDEIVPTVQLPHDEVVAFKESVMERFDNPFIDHSLLAISLNSVSKWKARNLCSFEDHFKAHGSIPKYLTFSFAALMAFYNTSERGEGCLIGKRGNDTYQIKDDAAVLDFFAERSGKVDNATLVKDFTSNTAFWGKDLGEFPAFNETVIAHLDRIAEVGMRKALEEVIGE